MAELAVKFQGKSESIKLRKFTQETEQNLQTGLKKLGLFMERQLKTRLKPSNPTTFFYKSPHSELRSRTGLLRSSITHEMSRLTVKVAPAGPPARYALVNEFGATIPVTEKMRRFLHAKGIHLRASTTEIEIPARPWFWPTWKENKAKAIRMVMDSLMKPLR